MISSIANLVYDLPHELPNDLRLRILGNKDIIGKSKIWVGIEPSAQSSFQKLNFGNSSQKTHKSRFQIFLVLFSLTGFLYFVSNILSRIKALDIDKIIVNIKTCLNMKMFISIKQHPSNNWSSIQEKVKHQWNLVEI